MDAEAKKRAFTLLVLDNKSPKKVSDEMQLSGFEVSEEQIRYFKETLDSFVYSEEGKSEFEQHALHSIKQATETYDTIKEKLESIISEAEASGKTSLTLAALRDLKGLLELSLRRQKLLGGGINIHSEVNTGPQNRLTIIKELHESLFDNMGAELIGNEIVFKRPSPEFIESYNRWLKKRAMDATKAQ